MIVISKRERVELEKMGFKMGIDIFHTVGKRKTYYASESPKVKTAIVTLRKID